MNGSRTICHAPNDLQELTLDEFKRAVPDVSAYAWIHFEGRNFDAVRQMIDYVLSARASAAAAGKRVPRVSVEAEKVRPAPAVEQLLTDVDVVFMSKDFARAHGCVCMQDAVVFAKRQLTSPHVDRPRVAAHTHMAALLFSHVYGQHAYVNVQRYKALVVCAWGEEGACASTIDGDLISVSAHRAADGARDTLGAGDTFIAAALHRLNGGANVHDALRYASMVAGRKCAQRGLLSLDCGDHN